jgi:dCMP deaminase
VRALRSGWHDGGIVEWERPGFDAYFMGIAMAVRRRADCTGNRVGAVIVRDHHIVATGYNGTPKGMANCSEGGCRRCANPADFPSGTAYDLCICVHAESNALLQAAAFGISVQGGTIFTTMHPCFGCTKELLQAGVARLVYLHPWAHPDGRYREEHERLLGRFAGGVERVAMTDPDEVWAVRRLRERLGGVSEG